MLATQQFSGLSYHEETKSLHSDSVAGADERFSAKIDLGTIIESQLHEESEDEVVCLN